MNRSIKYAIQKSSKVINSIINPSTNVFQPISINYTNVEFKNIILYFEIHKKISKQFNNNIAIVSIGSVLNQFFSKNQISCYESLKAICPDLICNINQNKYENLIENDIYKISKNTQEMIFIFEHFFLKMPGWSCYIQYVQSNQLSPFSLKDLISIFILTYKKNNINIENILESFRIEINNLAKNINILKQGIEISDQKYNNIDNFKEILKNNNKNNNTGLVCCVDNRLSNIRYALENQNIDPMKKIKTFSMPGSYYMNVQYDKSIIFESDFIFIKDISKHESRINKIDIKCNSDSNIMSYLIEKSCNFIKNIMHDEALINKSYDKFYITSHVSEGSFSKAYQFLANCSACVGHPYSLINSIIMSAILNEKTIKNFIHNKYNIDISKISFIAVEIISSNHELRNIGKFEINITDSNDATIKLIDNKDNFIDLWNNSSNRINNSINEQYNQQGIGVLILKDININEYVKNINNKFFLYTCNTDSNDMLEQAITISLTTILSIILKYKNHIYSNSFIINNQNDIQFIDYIKNKNDALKNLYICKKTNDLILHANISNDSLNYHQFNIIIQADQYSINAIINKNESFKMLIKNQWCNIISIA